MPNFYSRLCLPLAVFTHLFADNQTDELSSILGHEDIPFSISIEQAPFSLPNGWHSGAIGAWQDQCLLIAGRSNGLHGFDNIGNNFPPSEQNTEVYVINLVTGATWHRSLYDPLSGLSQEVIDSLSVVSPQHSQQGSILYMTGGYGINTATQEMETKPILTAIDIPLLIDWVRAPSRGKKASSCIRQAVHPFVQVTGGEMVSAGPHFPMLLVFGQNFTGLYRDDSNGAYTNQVRSFSILDNGKDLRVVPINAFPQHEAYRRRDLNVVPIMTPGNPVPKEAYVALSGVFTLTDGIWTVPVTIDIYGNSYMPDPFKHSTFKQGMNNYASAYASLFSEKTGSAYIVLFGGLTFGFFENNVFNTDSEIPFTNEVTTIAIDRDGNFSQHLMNNQYPTILSTFSNPGNVLLFGASGYFRPLLSGPLYSNTVINLDQLPEGSTTIGYVIGGIQSTVPNTSANSDSAASPYIFSVKLSK